MSVPTGGQTLDVLVVGDLMVDVVAAMSEPFARDSDTPSTVTIHGGGSGANVAAWLAVQGVRTTYVGCVGDDMLGHDGVATLAATGVDTRHVVADPGRRTGTCVVMVEPDGERSMLPDPGANDALTPQDLPDELFRPGRHLHLAGYILLRAGSRDAGLHALSKAAEAGMTVSVDPSSEALLVSSGVARFLEATRGVHLLLPNVDEARCLTGGGRAYPSGVQQAAEALASTYSEVVVTRGREGALWRRGFITATAPAETTADVVDTTGAGDAFAAGFLAGWLLHPEPETALAAGNRLAAQAIGRVGARP